MRRRVGDKDCEDGRYEFCELARARVGIFWNRFSECVERKAGSRAGQSQYMRPKHPKKLATFRCKDIVRNAEFGGYMRSISLRSQIGKKPKHPHRHPGSGHLCHLAGASDQHRVQHLHDVKTRENQGQKQSVS